MPLGFERLNERRKRPNDCINFIKPLETSDKELAQDFLERIAAICYPVMRANHITVMALEEYEANLEFVGRNFNAGEVIQLCLKAPFSGRWLPFRHVQMVMMHELAHCKQMNHSKFFWQVRNDYAAHLRELWAKDYYGEGLWGKGQTLLSGRYATEHMPEAASEVKSLCGGTYRGRGNKRKRKGPDDKPKVTYAERQQRRIARKFGVHGEGAAVGEDVSIKSELEKGKKTAAKPTVAKSKRGRDLRAAAALARFETIKQPTLEETIKTESDSELDWSDSYYGEVDDADQLVDDQGQHVKDAAGHGLVRVCEDEDPADDNARREMDELRAIDGTIIKREPGELMTDSDSSTESELETIPAPTKTNTKSSARPLNDKTLPRTTPALSKNSSKDKAPTNPTPKPTTSSKPKANTKPSRSDPPPSTTPPPLSTGMCPICSFANDPGTATCMVCAHVLDKRKIPGAWQCKSPECVSSQYVNAGDCGICGICGAAKQ